MLTKLSSLSVSCKCKLNEQANKFYNQKHDLNEAVLLTRCYIQHALRPYTDSEINHIRHFIKIPFINKGIEFIALPSIFRYNTIMSSIPSYFENMESPVICYKDNKPLRNIILNFNQLVSDLDNETVLLILESERILNFVSNQLVILSLEIWRLYLTLESVRSFLKDLNTDFLPTLT